MLEGRCEYRVPYADTDKMGFVYYANYLVIFERGRNELMRQMGFTYVEMESRGLGLPVLEAHLNYHRPAKYDDLLTVRAAVIGFEHIRVKVACQVLRQQELLVDGYTVHAIMNLQTGHAVRPPEEVAAVFRNSVVATPFAD